MAKAKDNMFDTFALAAQKREQEQAETEAAVTGEASAELVNISGKVRKRGENAKTVQLSISLEDKIRFKMYATRKGMSLSDLLHIWIVEHCDEA